MADYKYTWDGNKISFNGKKLSINTNWTGMSDSYVYNNWLGGSTGTKEQLKEAIQFYLENGRHPTGADFEGKISSDQYNNIMKDLETFKIQNNISDADIIQTLPEDNELRIQYEEDMASGTKNEYYTDMTDMDTEGTFANKMYETYKQAGEQQYNIGKRELAGAEIDMQKEMAANRQDLLDQIRSDRRNKLKSGLSSAQVANEEMQYMMQGQQQAQNIAGQYMDRRTNLENMYGMNDVLARQQTMGQAPALLGAGSAFAASDATDYYQQALKYAQRTGKTFQDSWDYINPNKE